VTCQLYEQQLSSYLDGELPAARAARLEAHLQVCERCRAELTAMRNIAQHIRAASGEVKVSTDFDQRVLRAVGYYSTTRGKRKVRAGPLAVAAVILLTLLGLIRHFLWEPFRPPVRAAQPAAAGVAPAAVGVPLAVDQEDR
jgi:anti-sigma factor RsiW